MKANPLLIGLLCYAQCLFALRLPIKLGKRSAVSITKTTPKTFASFNAVSKAASKDGEGDASLSTVNDLLYTAVVKVGGNDFTLQLDTGSSDLWVATNQTIPNAKPSDLTYNLTYGLGWAAGQITQATVSFAGFDVPNQAFILATQANNPISTYGAVGILGLGFTSLSSIDSKVNSTGGSWGRAFLLNAFKTDTSTPNFISFTLQRAGDATDDVDGTVTIGEYVEGLEAVKDMPNVPTWPEADPDRWNTLLDGLFIGGELKSVASSVKQVPGGKIVMLMDTGTSYSYVGADVANLIYGGISGAKQDSATGQWTVPCDAEVDVTFVIGGNPYPLHPLDVVTPKIGDNTSCVGSFVGQSLSFGTEDPEFDWLVGDNVLRSMYTLYDFGDFDSKGKMGNPYLKVLSLTNATQASIDFHAARGGSPNTTISASGVNLNGTNLGSGTVTTTDQVGSDINKLLGYIPALLGILAFNSVVLLALAGCALLYFMKSRKRQNGRGAGNRTADYQYQRVRSQYEPRDGPAPLPGAGRDSIMLNPPTAPSRQNSSNSITKVANPQDEPFTPPAEIDGDVGNVSLIHPEQQMVPMPASSPSGSPLPYDPAAIAPIPRPRFMSTTTVGSADPYGRPQSLFTSSTGNLLAPSSPRPASTYDAPFNAPRPRFISDAGLADARPNSTFSTAPLVANSPNQSPTRSAAPQNNEELMMAPPRPRFMSNVGQNRPTSSFSMDSGLGGAVPMRPQSKFMDVSGQRPLSEAPDHEAPEAI